MSLTYSGDLWGVIRVESEWTGSRADRPFAVAAPVWEGGAPALRILSETEAARAFSLVIISMEGSGTAEIFPGANEANCSGENPPCARGFLITGLDNFGAAQIVRIFGTVEVEERTADRVRGRIDGDGGFWEDLVQGPEFRTVHLEGTFDLPVTLLGCTDAACAR